ncbi:MAG: HAD-IIIA family hydrolase [Acidobacteriota bacterium]|nr:HAD-IIIA family hydrolase [Acidobacteriota bacterium]
MSNRRAVFFDLQGTLGGEGFGHILNFSFYHFAIPAIKLINESGLIVVITTNQSDIGKGRLTYKQFEAKMGKLKSEVVENGGRVDAAYCCPHIPSDGCVCRKPLPGMLHRAERDFDLCLPECYVVGDMGVNDIGLAGAVGCKGILVRTGMGESSLLEYRHEWREREADYIANDVLDAALWVTRETRLKA